MYGLMKAHICSRPTEASQHRRLHYCGTCKTMGRLYGQKSRFLLNNDAVFLAELLTALSPDAKPIGEWERAYQSYNCFAIPKENAALPLPLQVAAAATLVMTDFKVADQITDGGNGGWKMARRVFAAEFANASAQMQAWGFPIEAMREWGDVQQERERAAGEPAANSAALDVLAEVAHPTAMVTGLVFRHGAATVGCDTSGQERMQALGFAFGVLVYTLDAYDDYAKDTRKGDFNALQAAFRTPPPALPDCYETAALTHLNELRVNVERALWTLGLPQETAQMFVTRLRSNLANRLGEPLEGHVCATPAIRPPFRARWKSAVSLARTLTVKHREQHPRSLLALLALPFLFMNVLAIALVFPRQALSTASYWECRDIAFNLIFLGEAVMRMMAVPGRLVPAFAGAGAFVPGRFSKETNVTGGMEGVTHSSSTSSTPQVVKVRRNRGGGCCNGCCACCEGIECCGQGCCCTCEGIECCGSCAEGCGGCGDCASGCSGCS